MRARVEVGGCALTPADFHIITRAPPVLVTELHAIFIQRIPSRWRFFKYTLMLAESGASTTVYALQRLAFICQCFPLQNQTSDCTIRVACGVSESGKRLVLRTAHRKY
jgi:hypothetical protein